MIVPVVGVLAAAGNANASAANPAKNDILIFCPLVPYNKQLAGSVTYSVNSDGALVPFGMLQIE